MKTLRFACALVIAASVALAAQTNPVPFVSQPLVPMNAAPGSAGFTLTVNGAGFLAASVVNWDGSARATTFVSSTQLTASITSADVATAGTAEVTVVNPAGGGTSNAVGFAVTTPTFGPFYIETGLASGGFASAAADFNGDGHLDLADAVNTTAGIVYVRLGGGDGTFQSPLGFATAKTPYALATADFNRDGKPDLATANLNGTMSILIGNGDGTFQTHVDYPTGAQAQALSIGDFNGDGNIDLVVANSTPSGGVSVFLGRGDGTFQPQVVYGAGPTPYSVAVGDLNGDGKLDLAVADNAGSSSAVSTLMGNGDGTFRPANVLGLGNVNPSAVLAADFNSDGVLDLALAEAEQVSVLLGKGDGTFFAPRSLPVSSGAGSLVAADFNGDAILDLAVSNSNRKITILLGKNDGRFLSPVEFNSKFSNLTLSVGDFDGDGNLDFATGYSVVMQTTLSVSPHSLTFTREYVGNTSDPQTVTLKNWGTPALDISIAIGNNFTQTNDCGSSLASQQSCQISVVFAPATDGALTGRLTVTDNAYGSPQKVSLHGTGGIPPGPTVTLSPNNLTFGAQNVGTTSATQNVTMTNTGKVKLTISSIVASGDFAQTNTCGTTLLVNQNCTIIVSFTPTATGARTGAITITDNALNSPQTVPLTGTGQ